MSLLNRLPAWTFGPILIAVGAGVPVASKHFGLSLHPATVGLIAVAVFVLVIAGSVVWWRGIDEAAREAHKFAWYWGASIGMAVAAIGFVVLTSHYGVTITTGWNGRTTPRAFVELGMIGILVPQVIGYVVAWAGWWLSKR